ncbi:MAG: baseplate J/gp47 family protein, partial [Bacteroidota bacterium]
ELVVKPLTTVDLKMVWPQVPASFAAHYAPYDELLSNSGGSSEASGLKNEDFKARLSFKDRYTSFEITDDLPLFALNGATADESHVSVAMAERLADVAYQFEYRQTSPFGEVLEAERYFTLEYNGTSFLNDEYLLAQVAYYTKIQSPDYTGDIKPLPKPYVPKLKSLQVSYTAEQLLFEDGQPIEDGHTTMVYKVPFGTAPLKIHEREKTYSLVYPYHNSGELYIGLQNAKPGDAISLLFQLSDGSTDVVTTKPVVKWSYLSDTIWRSLDVRQQLLDRTNELTQTGIKILQLPRDIATGSSELPGDLLWLRAVVPDHSETLPKFVALCSGVGHVTLKSDAPAAHYKQLLPADSITELSEYIPEVTAVSQPFPSSKGRPAEDQEDYYYRISKRLRHKNRALTMWDYEQLVLMQFPIVFKVKCLTSDHLGNAGPGAVTVLVIPDLRGQVPFTPLQPRLPGYELANILKYLQQVSPPYAALSVSNPDYKEIKVRLGVKFMPGYQEDLSKSKLISQIRQFLSPWAYDASEELSFGGEIYANALIGYIENLPYVDYVSNVKLFEREKDDFFHEIFPIEGMLKAVAGDQKTVIVSAETHVLDVIGEQGYVVEQFTGINFNKIELDFRVGDD